VHRAPIPAWRVLVTVGEDPDLPGSQLEPMARIGMNDPAAPHTVAEATQRLRQAMNDRQALVIVASLGQTRQPGVRITGPRGRLPRASRDEQVIIAEGCAPTRDRSCRPTPPERWPRASRTFRPLRCRTPRTRPYSGQTGAARGP
jgi:hypothetical protein